MLNATACAALLNASQLELCHLWSVSMWHTVCSSLPNLLLLLLLPQFELYAGRVFERGAAVLPGQRWALVSHTACAAQLSWCGHKPRKIGTACKETVCKESGRRMIALHGGADGGRCQACARTYAVDPASSTSCQHTHTCMCVCAFFPKPVQT